MSSPSEDSNDVLEALLEQSFLHIRHADNHRLWFTNMYFLIVAGVLAYLATQAPAFVTLLYPTLVFFLLLLASIGLVVSYKETRVVEAYDKVIENILADALGKRKVNRYFAHLILRREPIFGKKRKGLWRSAELISLAYKLLYVISIGMWICLLYPYILAILN